MQKLQPALQQMLLPEESVLFIARCQSPLSALEQLTAAAWTAMLAAAAIVVTSSRILFIPVKRDGTWRESVRSVKWGDVTDVKAKGWLSASLAFTLRNGSKLTYTRLRKADAKKLASIAPALLQAASGEISADQGVVQLCPDCRANLVPQVYSCKGCALTFKNEKSMILRSIFLPAGGYFYTGHPLIALIPAIVEVFLLLEIVLIVLGGLKSPQAVAGLIGVLVYFAIVWAIESIVTIFHCRRYIREFIPEKRDPSRQQALGAMAGK
ncbi:MAG TPA: PH domain-containing protein [Terriglobales bacterium]|nr:PH domain-containing protein [Terriglobales bacterium]